MFSSAILYFFSRQDWDNYFLFALLQHYGGNIDQNTHNWQMGMDGSHRHPLTCRRPREA
jgi:hypothetical protein